MFELLALLALNLYVQDKLNKDEVYFLDNEIFFYTLLLWIVPVIGGMVILYILNQNKMFEIQLRVLFIFMSIGMYMLYKAIKYFIFSPF